MPEIKDIYIGSNISLVIRCIHREEVSVGSKYKYKYSFDVYIFFKNTKISLKRWKSSEVIIKDCVLFADNTYQLKDLVLEGLGNKILELIKKNKVNVKRSIIKY